MAKVEVEKLRNTIIEEQGAFCVNCSKPLGSGECCRCLGIRFTRLSGEVISLRK